jgi:hypothetical protein
MDKTRTAVGAATALAVLVIVLVVPNPFAPIEVPTVTNGAARRLDRRICGRRSCPFGRAAAGC